MDSEEKHQRVIVTKHDTIEIPDGLTGIPAAEFFGDKAALSPDLKNALVYEIDGRHYIARQDDAT